MKNSQDKSRTYISIQQKMTIVFSLLFALVFIAQNGIFILFLSGVVSTRANNYILQTLIQTNGKLDTYIGTLGVVSKSIVANDEIRKILINSQETGGISYNDNEKIATELSKITLAYDNINSIQIFMPDFTINYNFISEIGSYVNIAEIYGQETISASRGELVLLSPHKEYVDKISGETAYAFSAVRKFIDYQTGEEMGYLFVNVNENALSPITDATISGNSGKVVVFDREGLIVSSRDSAKIGASVDGELLNRINEGAIEGYYITTSREVVVFAVSQFTGWGTVVSLPIGEVTSEYNDLMRMNLILGAVGILMAALGSLIVSKGLTHPLKALASTMERIQGGDLTAKVEVKNRDEIGQIGDAFNQMTTQIQFLIEQYYEAELSEKVAELKAIQAQINPHFLYNALDTIYWMLVVRGDSEVSDHVISLSEILRYSISSGPEAVPLSREIELLQHYLSIQKARFGSKLNWSLSFGPDVYMCSVPKMIMQPIVENSIIHAMVEEKQMLSVTITGRKEDERLVITIHDDGKGIETQLLERILDLQPEDTTPNHAGIGISAVSRRIALLFGEEYGVAVSSEVGVGTTVVLTLPLIKNQTT